ncbi:MAG TPA: glycosyltransferase family 39 protein [Verrucomicrobiae bacterium]|jgi:4-amino-4-deoxy-L-arabinose transferase-like glycosyltransferase|nr:glycosyltransferase family 39 protein [Verrucomicrobiae bacterium]
MLIQIQSVIHKLEEGGGLRPLKWCLLGLAVIALALTYNYRGFKDMNSQEAMDSAQLARNLATHRGYTTLFIRPLSVYLVEKAYADKNGSAAARDMTDRSRLRTAHPDLANPPVYPFLLAAVMKIFPGVRSAAAGATTLNIGRRHLNIWNYNGGFWIYPPDFWIGLINQGLFFLTAVMMFFLARRLFDKTVAWTSAALFIGTDLFWRFSMSGLSTMLVMLIFVGLAWCVLLLEQHVREKTLDAGKLTLLAAGTGAVVGIGFLTRYSFGWLIIPVLLFSFLFLGAQRIQLCSVTLGVFIVIIAPWVFRNYHLSHTLFGTAGFAPYANTAFFPDYRLERSLNPDLGNVYYVQLWNKLLANTQSILQDELPKLGGSWIGAFFFVGLFINFKDPRRSRLRYFVFFCLPFLILAQAMGRTQLSDDSPVLTTENLLVIVSPLIVIFGVSLFYIVLDQIEFPIIQLRYLVVAVFCVIICLPAVLLCSLAVFSLFATRSAAAAYPPYFPPAIQKAANWMKPDELMMSDVPWAVAWYGDRQCIWLTLNAKSEFFAVSDYKKPVRALYLTPITMDSKFLTQWVRAGENNWGSFVLDSLLKKELPDLFPLQHAPEHFLPEQLFLTDSDRWAEAPAAVP